MTDTTLITNKNGIDKINRIPLVKNKNCTKMINIVDNKGVSLFVDFCSGSKNDCKCLLKFLDEYLSKNIGIVTFLGDSGFYTQEILDLLKSHNVKTLIAKNVRNCKKYRVYNKKGKKKKLTYFEKIERQLEDMTTREKNQFKQRGKIENLYANYKQIKRFALRYDRYVINLYLYSLLYFCEQFLKHI